MPALVWTDTALHHLARLEAFLAEKNPHAAQNAIAALLSRTQTLADFPEIGRLAPDLDPEHRELPVTFANAGYVIGYYYRLGSAVEILHVRHMSEDDLWQP